MTSTTYNHLDQIVSVHHNYRIGITRQTENVGF